MKRLAGAFLLAVSLALPAHAQDKAPLETMQAARELAAIMRGDTVEQLSRAMAAQVWPTIEAQVGGKVDTATLTEMRGEFERALVSFTTEVMKGAPDVYARHFSAKELQDMIAFYKSPTGVKALHEMPKVMGDVSTQMAPRLQSLQGELSARMRAIMAKHGYKD